MSDQLKAGPRSRRVELPDYLPARMLNEFVYCPRLFFYEWVEGVFAHSGDTVEGSLRHEKLDAREDPLPPAEDGVTLQSRSVALSSETYKLIATLDLVDSDSGAVIPVDYKKGRPKPGADGVAQPWPSDRIQIAVQALVLRDNGYRCDEGVVYYHETRQRVRIPIDAELVAETLAAIEAARATAALGVIPSPLVDSPKCPRCSLVAICLPDETLDLEAKEALALDPQLSLFDETPSLGGAQAGGGPEDLRRLIPARDDLRPLYVTGHGVTIGKTGELLQIRGRDRVLQEARLGETSQVNVFGAVQLSARAIQGLCQADKPIAHFSYGGWFYGLTQGLGLRNVFLRRAQFAHAEEPFFSLHVARSFVASKILNQRTLLQRNHIELPAITASRLKQAASAAMAADSLEVLLGIEGAAARLYFEAFDGMIKTGEDDGTATGEFRLEFKDRNRRPPRDPMNALLSFAYSLLAKDLTIICAGIGFDPFMGFYHQPRFGRPALALDLMEEFRPLIADSAVITAVNTKMVHADQFIAVGQAVAMKPAARKALIQAYEQRMDALVTHPLFGYRVNYRRVLEIQARLLARVVTGELHRYTGFETR